MRRSTHGTSAADSHWYAAVRLLGMSPRRAFLLAARIAGNAYLGSGPYKAVVCATYRCDCHCSFCGIWRRQAEELPAAVLVEALARLPGIAWVDVTGGELFLRPDYEELCVGLARRLPSLALFHFPTAGQRPEEALKLARTMSGRGIRTVVTVSIDGPPALHDRLRGVPGAWDRAMETFLALRAERGIDVFLGTTLVPENVDSYPQSIVEAIKARCPDISPHEFHVNVMQRSGHYFSNQEQELPTAAQLGAALTRAMRWRGLPHSPFALLEWAYQMVARRATKERATPLCQALRTSFFLAPNGLVQPCHIWDSPVGRIDAANPNLAPWLTSAAAHEARTMIAGRRCPVCWTPCEAYPTLLAAAANPCRTLNRKPS